MCRTAVHYLDQNATGAEVEKPWARGFARGREEKAARGEAVWPPQTGRAPVRSLGSFQSEGKPLDTSLQEPGMGHYILKG